MTQTSPPGSSIKWPSGASTAAAGAAAEQEQQQQPPPRTRTRHRLRHPRLPRRRRRLRPAGGVGRWTRGSGGSATRSRGNKDAALGRLCDQVDVAAAFFRPNNSVTLIADLDLYSWIVDRQQRPPNNVLCFPTILVPMIYLYSCTCFLTTALNRPPTATLDRNDCDNYGRRSADDLKRECDDLLCRFARSFDVALGYSAGLCPACVISKSDSMDKMREICVELMTLAVRSSLCALEHHSKQWGKEAMTKSWMCLAKGPLPVLEKRISQVNAEFPTKPLFTSIILAPSQTVVCGVLFLLETDEDPFTLKHRAPRFS
ncbi:hypothetical protein Pelo_6063 [Pelomyxa schiedti]|nr:hypothetical protein Pelo_6063 [Pelomyxa schiedti]